MNFLDDRRAQSVVIGTVILFGFLILALSLYQVQIVPQQNSQIEFKHAQDVTDNMVEVRSAILEAGQANVSRYPTVSLGTTYPTRLIAINPPPPAGTLDTSPAYDIEIDNTPATDTDEPKRIPTRFLRYQNGYNELQMEPIWYENSVLYVDARSQSGGGVAVIEDQSIITGDDSARVTALQNEFRVSSTGEATIDLYPTQTTNVSLDDLSGNVTIRIPTRLNGSAYWDEAIAEMETSDQWEYLGTVPHSEEPGIYYLELTVSASSLKFNTVGVDAEPDDQGSASQGVGPQAGGGGDGGGGNACTFPESGDPGVIYVTSKQNQGYTYGTDTVVIDGVKVNGGISGNGDLYIRSGSKINGGINIGSNTIYTELDSVKNPNQEAQVVYC